MAARLADVLDAEVIFAFAVDPVMADKIFPGRKVKAAGRIGASRFARRHWRWLLPLMSTSWRALRIPPCDLLVTSSHSCVNSVRKPRGAVHVSYCHTPMRYAWEWREEGGRIPAPLGLGWPLVAAVLRWGDRRRARNVDVFIANSEHVASRIRSYYDRPSCVVYPPIDTGFWTPPATPPRERDHYLVAGRLVAYKRPHVAVQAANEAHVNLVVAGDGPELPRLRRLAGPTIHFEIGPSGQRLRDLYRTARALVFPGTEDFGMTLVEAQACGTPVIAARAGGALESVVDGVTGVLFAQKDELPELLRTFDPSLFQAQALVANAERFSTARFARGLTEAVAGALAP